MKQLFTLLSCLCSLGVFAQTPYARYLETAGNADYAQKMVLLPDGSCVLAARNFTDSTLHLIKIDPATGAVRWDKAHRYTAGGFYQDLFIATFEYTSDNKLLLGGEYHQNGFPNEEYPVAMLFDTSGNMLWNFQDNNDEYNGSINEVLPGRYLMAVDRLTASQTLVTTDLLKLNGTPAILQAKHLSFFNSYIVSMATRSADNKFILAGNVASLYGTPFHYDVTVTKTDTALNLLWTRAYRDTLMNSVAAILPGAGGGFMLLGLGYFATNKDNGVVVMSIDSAGAIQWARQYTDSMHSSSGTAQHLTGYNMVKTADGNYLICGSYQYIMNGASNTEGILLKIDPSGNLLFSRTYGDINKTGTPAIDWISDVRDIGGKYCYAGRTDFKAPANTLYGLDDPATTAQTCFYKMNPVVLVTDVQAQIRDTAITLTASAASPSFGPFNYTATNSGNAQALTYCPAAVREQELGHTLRVYPNPFYTGVTFRMAGIAGGEAQLRLLDITGRTVRTATFNASEARVERGSLPSGVYFYVVTGREGVLAKGKLTAE